MSLFSRQSEEKQAAPQEIAQKDAMASLRARFNVARCTKYCRTKAYIGAGGAVEWLSAVEFPDRSWHVLAVRNVAPSGNAAQSQRSVKENASFLSAIEYMAKYEISAGESMPPADPAYQPHDDYFRPCAEAEMIVFDEDGYAHPTIDGLIVTRGDFPPQAQEMMLRHAKKLPRPVPLVPGCGEDTLEQLLAACRKIEEFDGFLARVESLQAIMEYYRTSFDIRGRKAGEFDFARIFKLDADVFKQYHDAYRKQSETGLFSVFCFRSLYTQAHDRLNAALGDAAPHLMPALERHLLYFEIMLAKACARAVHDSYENRHNAPEIHAQALVNIRDIAAKLGDDDGKLREYIAHATSVTRDPMPAEMTEFLAVCRKMRENMQKEADGVKARMAGKEPFPAPGLRK